MEARPLRTAAQAREALAVVDAAQAVAPHGELIDENERQRLARLAQTDDVGDQLLVDWRPFLAAGQAGVAGYGAILLLDDPSRATGELVVHPDRRGEGTGHLLMDRLEAEARASGVRHLSVWARDDASSKAFAASRGYTLDRRLDVLGRDDEPVPAVELPEHVTIRSHRPGPDDDGVIATLNAAFPDSGRPWTSGRLDAHRALDWFDPQGVLIAEAGDGRILGVHWTKDRGGGTGEVHILGLHPDAHGMGLGRALLRAGLAFLYSRGAHEVILWMDHRNEPAKRLYTSEGFAFRWADIAYGRDLT